jgi:hypothetical protein
MFILFLNFYMKEVILSMVLYSSLLHNNRFWRLVSIAHIELLQSVH